MGERALAACRLPTGALDCYRSQWAASETALRAVFGSGDPALVLGEYDWSYEGRRSWSELLETLDFLRFEAVYRLAEPGLSVYLPLWLGFGSDERSTAGVLVEVRSAADYSRLRKRFRRQKRRVSDAVERGAIGAGDARLRLAFELVSSREFPVVAISRTARDM